jgi:regulator of protease activity HflC (stomatin/prohibitin superfamily)
MSATLAAPTPTPTPAPMQTTTPQVTERRAHSINGWPVVILGILGIIGCAWAIGVAIAGAGESFDMPLYFWASIVALVLIVVLLTGLTPVAPGQARVVQLLGRYVGTIRQNGLRWVNPLTTRKSVSTKLRNQETEVLKVNDLAGNPIEIAAVVVWQVTDTAMASFDVDNFVDFVSIQTETAVRHIANSYPYDNNAGTSRLSLRDNAEEITAELSAEMGHRVAPAGVRIIESRLTRLAYASEIAQAMLRRQQADAVVAARARIVEGAVGMVEQALHQLEEQDVVVLDDERKAVMVSNLLVVLCSEQNTQPVVNAGSLY